MAATTDWYVAREVLISSLLEYAKNTTLPHEQLRVNETSKIEKYSHNNNNSGSSSPNSANTPQSSTSPFNFHHTASTPSVCASVGSYHNSSGSLPTSPQRPQAATPPLSPEGGNSSSEEFKPMAGQGVAEGQACTNCQTTYTTMWRKDATCQIVCNACGLYERLNKVPRPLHMANKKIHRRKPRRRTNPVHPPIQRAIAPLLPPTNVGPYNNGPFSGNLNHNSVPMPSRIRSYPTHYNRPSSCHSPSNINNFTSPQSQPHNSFHPQSQPIWTREGPMGHHLGPYDPNVFGGSSTNLLSQLEQQLLQRV